MCYSYDRTVKLDAGVGGEEEQFFKYFLASLRARNYEIKLSTKVDDDLERRHLPYFS